MIHHEITKYIVDNSVILMLLGFQNPIEMSLMGLESWLFDYGKVLQIFLKEFVRTLCLSLQKVLHFLLALTLSSD